MRVVRLPSVIFDLLRDFQAALEPNTGLPVDHPMRAQVEQVAARYLASRDVMQVG
jgi:hypothetical protein